MRHPAKAGERNRGESHLSVATYVPVKARAMPRVRRLTRHGAYGAEAVASGRVGRMRRRPAATVHSGDVDGPVDVEVELHRDARRLSGHFRACATRPFNEGVMGEEGTPKTEMINPALLDGVSANFIVKGPSGVEKAYPMRAISVTIGRSDHCETDDQRRRFRPRRYRRRQHRYERGRRRSLRFLYDAARRPV